MKMLMITSEGWKENEENEGKEGMATQLVALVMGSGRAE
jgi:hypothetical protein